MSVHNAILESDYLNRTNRTIFSNRNKMPMNEKATWIGNDQEVTVLSVSPDGDYISLVRILNESDSITPTHSKWTVLASATPESAVTALREKRSPMIPIVVCESDLSPGSWKKLLELLTVLPDPPYLIVTSRLADERLWTEALNLGAYDVLAKPFDKEEVIRTLYSAWLHWSNQRGPCATPT